VGVAHDVDAFDVLSDEESEQASGGVFNNINKY